MDANLKLGLRRNSGQVRYFFVFGWRISWGPGDRHPSLGQILATCLSIWEIRWWQLVNSWWWMAEQAQQTSWINQLTEPADHLPIVNVAAGNSQCFAVVCSVSLSSGRRISPINVRRSYASVGRELRPASSPVRSGVFREPAAVA